MNIKKLLAGAATGGLMLGSMATAVLAAPPTDPGSYGTAAPNAQCDSGAASGAFAAGDFNYGFLGEVGGTPGYHDGAVGQQDGATGSNNSAVCGNTP